MNIRPVSNDKQKKLYCASGWVVFVLMDVTDYDAHSVLGVYSSMDAAIAAANGLGGFNPDRNRVDQIILDAPADPFIEARASLMDVNKEGLPEQDSEGK